MKKKSILELTRVSADDYRRMRKLPLALMADNVRSMHNVGSMLRTSDAFLVGEVVLAGITGRPPHPEISKTPSAPTSRCAGGMRTILSPRRQG